MRAANTEYTLSKTAAQCAACRFPQAHSRARTAQHPTATAPPPPPPQQQQRKEGQGKNTSNSIKYRVLGTMPLVDTPRFTTVWQAIARTAAAVHFYLYTDVLDKCVFGHNRPVWLQKEKTRRRPIPTNDNIFPTPNNFHQVANVHQIQYIHATSLCIVREDGSQPRVHTSTPLLPFLGRGGVRATHAKALGTLPTASFCGGAI